MVDWFTGGSIRNGLTQVVASRSIQNSHVLQQYACLKQIMIYILLLLILIYLLAVLRMRTWYSLVLGQVGCWVTRIHRHTRTG